MRYLQAYVSTHPFADTAGIYAHPTPENKRKAVEVLAAVFGGESEAYHTLPIKPTHLD